MQPVELTIPGRFWDSQIYSGRLYLFELDGRITTLDWDKVVARLAIEERLRFAALCAFQNSSYLYGDHWRELFRDREIRSVLDHKFQDLRKLELVLTPKYLRPHVVREQENPLPFPHADSLVYYNTLYVVSRSGVHAASCVRSNRYPVSTRPQRITDIPGHSLAGSYGSLALAGGPEGLFEFYVGRSYIDDQGQPFHPASETKVSAKDCTDCNWVYYSIYASSHTDEGYLASYRMEETREDRTIGQQPVTLRKLHDIQPESDIFKSSGYSWAEQDKIYQATDHTIKGVRFRPSAEDPEDRIESLEPTRLPSGNRSLLAAKVALFGTVVESEDALTILGSDGKSLVLPGRVVNWRVFPRSKNYENHLHVIHEDGLKILSFNHDYFVDQTEKTSGINYWAFHPRFIQKARRVRVFRA